MRICGRIGSRVHQIDLEMSFVEAEDVMNLMEEMMAAWSEL